MTLGEKQRLFARLVPRLIDKAYELGYEVTGGDWWAREGHRPGSCHYVRLALDLNLFRDGIYLTATEDHHSLGQYWKSLHSLCRWGGDFSTPDGNHYSMEHDGRA